jgi:lipoyl(octanoyl) transferase
MRSPAPEWRWLGRADYAATVAAQEERRERLLAGDDEAACVLLCEHPPVITLGRSADANHVIAGRQELAQRGIEVVATSRGGDVTYHGPGQLMVYPVVRLRRGVVWHLEAIAGALARVCALLGVADAAWRRAPAGLWVGGAKIAACGVHVRRQVAIHGFALDVATPDDPWRLIVPCGLSGARTTSIAGERAARGLPPPPPIEEVAALTGPILCRALAQTHPDRLR